MVPLFSGLASDFDVNLFSLKLPQNGIIHSSAPPFSLKFGHFHLKGHLGPLGLQEKKHSHY